MSTSHRRGRTPSLDLVAGNGLINRRALLGQGIAVAGAMGAAGAINGGSFPTPAKTLPSIAKEIAAMQFRADPTMHIFRTAERLSDRLWHYHADKRLQLRSVPNDPPHHHVGHHHDDRRARVPAEYPEEFHRRMFVRRRKRTQRSG